MNTPGESRGSRSFGLAIGFGLRRGLAALASLKLSLLIFIALALGIAGSYTERTAMTWPIAVPLMLLALNMMAALLTHPVFRQKWPLTLFHVTLIIFLLLAALGRLTYLKARVEISEGQAFDGVPVEVEQGPWHRSRLGQIGLFNERVEIDYSPELTIRATRNAVRWRDPAGHWQSSLVTENVPVSIFGYRFYVTNGKGFAPRFAWYPRTDPLTDSRNALKPDEPIIGSVHLPKYPSDAYAQQTEWSLPDGKSKIWVALNFDQPPLRSGQASRLQAPEADSQHHVVLWVTDPATPQGQRHELRPGESVQLADGVLEYRSLKLWMGYLVYYDWTVPWLLGTSVFATLALGAHFWTRFRSKAW